MKKTSPWRIEAPSRAAQRLLFAACLIAAFLVLNRGAYQSFFQDDEFDTLSWIARTPLQEWLRGLLSPVFDPNNFRPVGHFYYLAAHWAFGLGFQPFVAILQLAHLLNTLLVWRLARSLGVTEFGAAAGAAFFALNMAAIDAFWKPMYIFDVLCATFCLLSVLLYVHGRWIWSFLAFWLAYKSKELAVMLPAVLAAYEFWIGELWFGERHRLFRLAPFLAASLSFGLQAMLANRGRQDLYAFHLTSATVMQTAAYYSSRILLVRYAGAALLVVPFLFRDRRVAWGIASMLLFFVPLLLLPGRVFCAYVYVPLAFLAVALAALAGLHRRAFTILFFALWAIPDIHQLRVGRRSTLATAEESRPYFQGIRDFARSYPEARDFLYDGVPVGYHHWGITGMFRCAFNDPDLTPVYLHSAEAAKALQSPGSAILLWDRRNRKARFVTRQGS